MNQKLLEVLKKAKQVDQRAKQFDSTDTATLQANVNSRTPQTSTPGLTESVPSMNIPVDRPTPSKPKVDVNSEAYRQRVKESKLPPEVIQAMLDNPIQQPDSPGTFSMNEEMIKEVNPNYGTQNINQVPTSFNEEVRPKQSNYSVDESLMRKMIAEEIAKALPSIVENYFDKKMIQENIEVLKAIKVRKKTTNNRK
jgi:hypothetical protein